jgi:epoxyqueuosine reductase
MQEKIRDRIKEIIGNDEDYIVGYADLSGLLNHRYQGKNKAIVLGKKLDDDIVDSVSSGPNVQYYNLYNRTNKELADWVHKVGDYIESINCSAIVVEPTLTPEEHTDEFFRNLRYDFSHKMAATRAGLGWIGKTDLFISSRFGPRLRLATVLTDYPFELNSLPIDKSECGECNICVESCPAKAGKGELWNTNIDRDEFFDAFKCRKMCIELSKKNMGFEATICGICVSVCPVGKIKESCLNDR